MPATVGSVTITARAAPSRGGNNRAADPWWAINDHNLGVRIQGQQAGILLDQCHQFTGIFLRRIEIGAAAPGIRPAPPVLTPPPRLLLYRNC